MPWRYVRDSKHPFQIISSHHRIYLTALNVTAEQIEGGSVTPFLMAKVDLHGGRVATVVNSANLPHDPTLRNAAFINFTFALQEYFGTSFIICDKSFTPIFTQLLYGYEQEDTEFTFAITTPQGLLGPGESKDDAPYRLEPISVSQKHFGELIDLMMRSTVMERTVDSFLLHGVQGFKLMLEASRLHGLYDDKGVMVAFCLDSSLGKADEGFSFGFLSDVFVDPEAFLTEEHKKQLSRDKQLQKARELGTLAIYRKLGRILDYDKILLERQLSFKEEFCKALDLKKMNEAGLQSTVILYRRSPNLTHYKKLLTERLTEIKKNMAPDPNLAINPIIEPALDIVLMQVAIKAKHSFKPNYTAKWQDPDFPLYSANWISGCNFIAMAGPIDDRMLGQFFHLLLFNERLKHKPKVTTVIGLGNCLGKSDFAGQDFINYSIDTQNLECKQQAESRTYFTGITQKSFITYNVKVDNKYIGKEYQSLNGVKSMSGLGGCSSSRLTISNKQGEERVIDVHLIGVPDGEWIDLSLPGEETEKLMEILWKTSRESMNNAVAVHCHAGQGRTGHLILILELLKDYGSVFAGTDVDQMWARVEQIMTRIQITRPTLVATAMQKRMAVVNAGILYKWAYEKGYVIERGRVSGLGMVGVGAGANLVGQTAGGDEKKVKEVGLVAGNCA